MEDGRGELPVGLTPARWWHDTALSTEGGNRDA
jgi:hypothetical protein